MYNEEKLRAKILAIQKKRKLIRIGECKCCGQCCDKKQHIFKIVKDRIVFDCFAEKECPAYNKKTRKCTAHNQWRPVWCVLYPYTPESIIYKECGYHFEEEK